MVAARTLRRAVTLILVGASTAVWFACAERAADDVSGPAALPDRPAVPDLRGALAAQRRHTDALLGRPGVIGTAVGVLPDGRAGMQILLERPGITGLPRMLDGVPVASRVTGRLMASSDPTKRQRPAPLGFSVGHPAITAGTIGARVRDALGRVYILSNNHVLAHSNGATIGDAAYQPGPYDGGTAADQIATLTEFQTITFSGTANNTMDAAVALSSIDQLGNASPSDDGYGMPNAVIYGDADGDGLFDDRNALLGLNVQKYGRTTGLTHGQITGVNATVLICYEVSGFTCVKSARFVDQLLISPGPFSGGGDSGSLIVTDDGNVEPVALLFAGSSTVTVANRIDLVLNRFGVSIDGLAAPPPGPLLDVAVTSVSAAGPVVLGSTASVTVTVRNVGNQDVESAFAVSLRDATQDDTTGTQTVAGLSAGASTTLSFAWTPTSTGDHILVASHSVADDRAGNDQSGATVAVNHPVKDVGVTGVAVPGAVSQGHTVNVAVTVANVGNQVVESDLVITLEDTTAGVTIGSDTVAGLLVGAVATVGFVWNTTDAEFGNHVLVATHSLIDDNAGNDRRAALVAVTPKLIDVALTDVTGPARVTQGDTARVAVTVQNVGEQDVQTSFDVVLVDASGGGAIGTQTVVGLPLGAGVTLEFLWNTAGVAATGHTLIARQTLVDGNSGNDARAIGIIVNPGPTLVTDVAVTGVSTPGSVVRGDTATIGVTVQNVGQQDVDVDFDVVLTDATVGEPVGTQTVAGLGAGASTTLSFRWNTTGAALGGHSLVAAQGLTDDNATNDTRSVVVAVNSPPVDLAVTAITGPAAVTQGDTAHVGVTIENVGDQAVEASFDVVVTDAVDGATIGLQTVPGLAVDATVTLDFAWNTAGAAVVGHTLIARQLLPDQNVTNDTRAIGILVKAPVTLVTDLSLVGVGAPTTVTQGTTAAIGVTVRNVGDRPVETPFDIVLSDGTTGETIGTEAVAAVGLGATVTRTFPWNTTGTPLGGHTLVAAHTLSDANAANNQQSVVVAVEPSILDVALTTLTGPGTVTQGNTATIGVTVRNVGERDVAAGFEVVLTDATAGASVASALVPGLAVGASAALTFEWITTNAALGSHTLVATHTVVDANGGNDERSITVAINPRVTDVAVTSLTGPGAVSQGATAQFAVTVRNVGAQAIDAGFAVVLTDATAGVTIGTEAVPMLEVGADLVLAFAWNTAGVATAGHTLVARQMLVDANPTNDARAIGVVVNPPSVHVGNLTGFAAIDGPTWSATADIVVHDVDHALLNDVTVRGRWGGPDVSECTTGGSAGDGTCRIVLSSIPISTRLVAFAVSGLTRDGYVYQVGANHDPDGSSNGMTVFVRRP